MASEYSLADVLERMYENQLALEAAIMELVLWMRISVNVTERFANT